MKSRRAPLYPERTVPLATVFSARYTTWVVTYQVGLFAAEAVAIRGRFHLPHLIYLDMMHTVGSYNAEPPGVRQCAPILTRSLLQMSPEYYLNLVLWGLAKQPTKEGTLVCTQHGQVALPCRPWHSLLFTFH